MLTKKIKTYALDFFYGKMLMRDDKMILKKPYAFFIKHFRLIHVLLFVLSGLTIYKSTPIVTFFRSYVENGYSTNLSSADLANVIPTLLFIGVFIIFLMNSAILSLFIYKKKKKNFYLFYTIYYLVFLILLFICHGILISFGDMTFSAAVARAYQDVALIAYLPQIPFVFVCAIRTLGFNIKQFNFERDLKDLEISSKDNEEIELSIGLETYKTKRRFNRFKREFKYYLKENTLMVIIASLVSIALIVYLIIASTQSYVSKRKIGENFSYDTFIMSIDDAIITNLDAGGNELGKYYLLLKVSLNNIGPKDAEFQFDNLKLYYTNSEYINPNLSLGTNFVDYAVPFTDSPIIAGSQNTYVFAYELSDIILKNKLFVKMNTGFIKESNLYYITSSTIDIDPIIIDKVSEINNVGLNQGLNLSGTYLLDTNVTINDYQVADKYVYNYTTCISKDNCRQFKDMISRTTINETILVLKGNVKIDESTSYYKTKNASIKFANYFFKVEYTMDGATYISNIINSTPSNFKEGYIFRVSNNLLNADTINLLVTIRNKQYRINLKS